MYSNSVVKKVQQNDPVREHLAAFVCFFVVNFRTNFKQQTARAHIITRNEDLRRNPVLFNERVVPVIGLGATTCQQITSKHSRNKKGIRMDSG